MVTLRAEVPPEVVVKKSGPLELLDSVRVIGPPVLAMASPKPSWAWTTKGPTEAEVPTFWFPVGLDVKANLAGAPKPTVNAFVVAEVTVVCVVSVAAMVRLLPAELIMRFEKLATPALAVAVAVDDPVENVPDDRVSFKASLFPVPVVTTLPYWSSTLTPTAKG